MCPAYRLQPESGFRGASVPLCTVGDSSEAYRFCAVVALEPERSGWIGLLAQPQRNQNRCSHVRAHVMGIPSPSLFPRKEPEKPRVSPVSGASSFKRPRPAVPPQTRPGPPRSGSSTALLDDQYQPRWRPNRVGFGPPPFWVWMCFPSHTPRADPC